MKLRFINEEVDGDFINYISINGNHYDVRFQFKHLLLNINTDKKRLSFIYDGRCVLSERINIEISQIKDGIYRINLEKDIQDIVDNNAIEVLKEIYKYNKYNVELKEYELTQLKDQVDRVQDTYSKEMVFL